MQINFPQSPPQDWPAQFIGKKWRWCGRGPDEYDCFGLMIAALRQFGIAVKDWVPANIGSAVERAIQSEHMIKASLADGAGWQKISAPVPGAAILFRRGRNPHHVGVCTGGGDFIHACESLGQVAREALSDHADTIVGVYLPKEIMT